MNNLPSPEPETSHTPEGRYDPLLHYLAVLTALATFPLIFMGGLVTSNHAGMSVPDWPNSYGYNMFLFPPRLWVGGILYEHTHRLMASAVGFLSLILATYAWRHQIHALLPAIFNQSPPPTRRRDFSRHVPEPNAPTTANPPPAIRPNRTTPFLRYLCLAVLGTVILQGVLGGLRVVLVKLDLAIVHACVAQAFFCLAALTALVSSRWWMTAATTPSVSAGFITLTGVAVVAIYLQLIVGAEMRHNDAGLAIPDLPLAYGHLLPPTTATELRDINHTRAWSLNLDPVTMGQVWIHFAHRIGAVVVSALLLTVIAATLGKRDDPLFVALGTALCILLLCQVSLGVLTVVYRKPADVASAHVAVGALLLVTAWLTFLCAVRLRRPGLAAAAANLSSESSQSAGLKFVPA